MNRCIYQNFSQQKVWYIFLASALPYCGLGRCVVGLDTFLTTLSPHSSVGSARFLLRSINPSVRQAWITFLRKLPSTCCVSPRRGFPQGSWRKEFRRIIFEKNLPWGSVLKFSQCLVGRSARSWLSSFSSQTAYRPMTFIWRYYDTSFFTSRRVGLK